MELNTAERAHELISDLTALKSLLNAFIKDSKERWPIGSMYFGNVNYNIPNVLRKHLGEAINAAIQETMQNISELSDR